MVMRDYTLLPDQEIPVSYEKDVTFELLNASARPGGPKLKPILAGDQVFKTENFDTWSLFLISNPGWLRDDNSAQIEELHQAYLGFGRAIGGDHAAVWFGKPASDAETSTNPAARIDAERCAEYARQLQLDLAKSPYIVVTTERPDLSQPLLQLVVLELGSLKASSAQKLLTELASQLVNARLDQVALKRDEWFLIWRDCARAALQTLAHLVQSVSISFKNGEWKLTL